MIHWKNTHLDKIEDADSITDDDHILFRQPEKNPLYMSNYNAIATEADFNGPEHTSWRGVQPARVVANIRVSTDFDLSKANFRKLNYYFNSEVCITVKKKESLEKKWRFHHAF